MAMTQKAPDSSNSSDTREVLAEHRRRMDALDDEIVTLLARRFDLVREVAELKAAHGIAARIPERIEEVCARNADHGALKGVDPDFLRALYARIVEASCTLEEGLLHQRPKD